jgi:hypothetical protein
MRSPRRRRETLSPWIGNGQLLQQGQVIAEIRYRLTRMADVQYTTVAGRTHRQEGQADIAGTFTVRRGTIPCGAAGLVLHLADGRRASVTIDGERVQLIGAVEPSAS